MWIGFAKVGSLKSEAKWIIFRIKIDTDDTLMLRIAENEETPDKIFDNYSTYDYVEL